ncbi:hypothetical protein [Actinoplanes auranticolor]|uniref:Protein ImuA n=1 Tax=Actinoplanes auranticolor TaxID=47988 RepID=A0A919SKK7_9ACTN|nr:hypothetical protein [Actinoplanes auranticolor]GIM73730.1 hypothetical protein Aau02nite_57390 [Actinoplanes auranticolor]
MPGKPVRPPRPSWSGDGRIAGPADVRRLLRDVNAAGLSRDTTALATHLVQPAEDIGLAEADLARVLPAPPALAGLFPWPGGIRRGATVAAVGSTSLVIALLAEAMSTGSWAAVVGMPTFGALAAAEAGVPLEHLALIPEPGPDWPAVVSAAIDGVDIVVVTTPPTAADNVTRALINRARQKGTVLIPTSAWAGNDLAITLTSRTWSGLRQGHGRLRNQQTTLRAAGRGRAARPRTVTVAMPPHQAEWA